MSEQVRPYETLTSENAALILVDHQVGLMTGVRDYSTGELKHNVVALAKAAKALNLPIVVTTTARDSMWGPTFPELVEALPGVRIGRRIDQAPTLPAFVLAQNCPLAVVREYLGGVFGPGGAREHGSLDSEPAAIAVTWAISDALPGKTTTRVPTWTRL